MIYQKRRQLRNIGGIDSLDIDIPESPFAMLTGIQVTREIACSTPERRSISAESARGLPSAGFRSYTVTIEGGSQQNKFQRPSSQIVPGPLQKETTVKTRPDVVDSQRRLTTETNSATWAYYKYAMLFFIALLVTWVSQLHWSCMIDLVHILIQRYRSHPPSIEYILSPALMTLTSTSIMLLALCSPYRGSGIA